MTLADLLVVVSAALGRSGMPYMVVGSLASSFHGTPRATVVVDIVIDPDHGQIDDLLDALGPGFYVTDAHAALDRRDMFNAIDTTSGWKVDFIVPGLRPFTEVQLGRRQEEVVEGVRMSVASAEDTILAKLEWAAASGSERQLRDVAGIVAIGGDGLDWEYLERWAAELGVTDLLRGL